MKTKADNLDVDKFMTIPADLRKLSNVLNNVVKTTVYDKLVIKVNATDTKIPSTGGLLTQTQYDSDKQGTKKKTDNVDKKTEISNLSIQVLIFFKGSKLRFPDLSIYFLKFFETKRKM